MSISFSDELIKTFDYLLSQFGIAVDWTSENVIPYLQTLAEKLVRFEINTSIMWLVIGVVGLIVGVWMFVKDIKDWDTGICLIGGILIIVAGVICCWQVYDIIKCVSFPELYVFEYIKLALHT